MKKFLAIGLLALSTTAFAHGYGHGYWRPAPSGGWHWVAPALIGGVIGYEIARPPIYNPPVVVQQPGVIIQSPPIVMQQQNCSPWTEIKNSDGTVTVTRTCSQ